MKKRKQPLRRTKIVIRHLPPSLSQSHLFSQFDYRFSHRYNWFCFCPGHSSHKHLRYSRAYIDFKNPEDVLEFADFFNGHVFVNEKGAQFKAIVEYAPSQRVPKPCNKKDAREGTIYEDPDYLEFLKLIAKPARNLPSAEIQLERKEAEESDAAKETPFVTPLMEFVRQKRAAYGGIQGSTVIKVHKRAAPSSLINSSSKSNKRGSGKKKYIQKGSTNNSNQKDKSIVNVGARLEDRHATSSGKEISEVESISGVESSVSKISTSAESGKKTILLLKGQTREISLEPEGMSPQWDLTSNIGNSCSPAVKQYRGHEASERLIKNILSSTAARSQNKFKNLEAENDKQSIQSKTTKVGLNDVKRTSEDKMKKDRHDVGSLIEKPEKHKRKKDRLDLSIWTPHQNRPGVQQANMKKLTPSVLQCTDVHSNSVQVTHGGTKDDIHYRDHTGESTGPTSGKSAKNAHCWKDGGSSSSTRGKFSKKGGPSGYTTHEKQVWVQKS